LGRGSKGGGKRKLAEKVSTTRGENIEKERKNSGNKGGKKKKKSLLLKKKQETLTP